MPKKGTKAWREEAFQVFYAVDRETLQVRTITFSRGRVLSYWRGDNLIRHSVSSGRLPEQEIGIVWGMTGVNGALIGVEGAERRAREETEKVAAEMRSRHQAGEPSK